MQAIIKAAAPVKAARKLRTPKAAAPANLPAVIAPEAVAKPDASAAREAKAADRSASLDATREARKLAAQAVSAYYAGASLPFKAAADRFADLRTDKAPKRATQRQAALLASMLCADGDNVKADGTFTRGGFVIDGKRVQPETGALSDMLGRVVAFVSGPISGRGQADSVLRIDLAKAAGEIREHIGGALATQALARIEALTK